MYENFMYKKDVESTENSSPKKRGCSHLKSHVKFGSTFVEVGEIVLFVA